MPFMFKLTLHMYVYQGKPNPVYELSYDAITYVLRDRQYYTAHRLCKQKPVEYDGH